MKIDFLADHPEFVDELARAHHAVWGGLHPDETLEQRKARLLSKCGRGGVPSVVVAHLDGALLGSASLIESDMSTRPDLTPWLASVYVLAPHRERGVGSALVTRIEAEAAAAGVARLYLYTPDRMSFYARLGWVAEERVAYLGEDVTVMWKWVGARA